MHKTKQIKYGQIEADIDEKIAPLILEIWKSGIATDESCQDYDGDIFIGFASTSDFLRFLHLLSCNSDYFKCKCHSLSADNIAWDDADWKMWNLLQEVDEAQFDFAPCLTFPPKDMSLIIEKLTGEIAQDDDDEEGQLEDFVDAGF